MYNIDFPKIVYIYVIILAIMYACVIQGNIVPNVSKYTDRRDEIVEENALETDYSLEKYSEVYLTHFINNINKMDLEELKTYFDEEYYNIYSNEIKKALMTKARIKDTKNNESYIELVRTDTNEFGQRVCVYNIIVMKKNSRYPEGYEILFKEKSQDKNKSMDIWVVEIAPYNYVLQIPNKEFVG